MRIGFVWDINGDRVEVRSYEGKNYGGKPTIKHMTRADACWYKIIPNPAHGNERPFRKNWRTPFLNGARPLSLLRA
jgi:hypothetical protein